MSVPIRLAETNKLQNPRQFLFLLLLCVCVCVCVCVYTGVTEGRDLAGLIFPKHHERCVCRYIYMA